MDDDLAGATRRPDPVGPVGPVGPDPAAVEPALLAVWARWLQRDVVPPDEDFFQLGGHSLIAMEILSEIERTFGVGISMGELYEFPTARQMAQRIAAHRIAAVDPR